VEPIEKDFEESIIEETRALMAIPEPQRSEYVKNVILSVYEAAKKIMNLPKLQQAQKANQLLNELNDKATILIPAVMYTIKPEFRNFYLQLMKTIEQEINKPKTASQ